MYHSEGKSDEDSVYKLYDRFFTTVKINKENDNTYIKPQRLLKIEMIIINV